MKQIEKTSSIVAKLNQQGLVADDVVVFEAIALNNRPLRKQNKLYKGAVASRGLLLEMAASLESETVPLQIMHDNQPLPIGRVFEGQVHDVGTETELRVLFAVSKSETAHIEKIEAGVVDQVSVSVLPKKILNSVSNFDYLGPESSYENIATGRDLKGNVLGVGGVHARLVGLDQWNELSLVGKGGAQNARIVSRDDSIFAAPEIQRLAASGVDPSDFLLTATLENDTVDLTALVATLTDTKVELAATNTKVTTLEADNAAKATRITDLEAQLAQAGDAVASLAAKDETITTLTADHSAAVTALKDVAKALLVAKGDVDPTLPDDVPALTALISETKTGLAAVLVAGARSIPASSDGQTAKVMASSAFRAPR